MAVADKNKPKTATFNAVFIINPFCGGVRSPVSPRVDDSARGWCVEGWIGAGNGAKKIYRDTIYL
jgi:hypothetical protein